MRVLSCLAIAAVLGPCTAAAQATTSDGVQALMTGDYAAAVRILRPLAEKAPEPDPVAQFFMAALYQRGLGVGQSSIRACGLYMSAGTSGNPLMARSLTLASLIHFDVPLMREFCFSASLGTWREPPASSFTLGRDHWVRIDEGGLIVGYQGVQRKAPMELGGPGWVFLPVRHTQVDVRGPAGGQRHFIEFFAWMKFEGAIADAMARTGIPIDASEQPVWTLHWWINEVVGGSVFPHGPGAIATLPGSAQPSTSLVIEDIARIGVTADGDVEWVQSGENPRRGIIPRQESR